VRANLYFLMPALLFLSASCHPSHVRYEPQEVRLYPYDRKSAVDELMIQAAVKKDIEPLDWFSQNPPKKFDKAIQTSPDTVIFQYTLRGGSKLSLKSIARKLAKDLLLGEETIEMEITRGEEIRCCRLVKRWGEKTWTEYAVKGIRFKFPYLQKVISNRCIKYQDGKCVATKMVEEQVPNYVNTDVMEIASPEKMELFLSWISGIFGNLNIVSCERNEKDLGNSLWLTVKKEKDF